MVAAEATDDAAPAVEAAVDEVTGGAALAGSEVGFTGTDDALEEIAQAAAAEAGAGGAAKTETFLYQKLSADGEHLKYGITKNPATRYTSAEMNGGRLNILASGEKADMLVLERGLHEWLPIGPEEGQAFYILKQIANGLRPPPYQ